MMEEFRNISVLLLAAQPGLHLTLFRQLCAAAADGDQAVGGEDGRLQPDQQLVQRHPAQAQPHATLPRAAGLRHRRTLRVLRALFDILELAGYRHKLLPHLRRDLLPLTQQ